MYFQYLKLNKIRAALLEEVDIAKEPGPEIGEWGGGGLQSIICKLLDRLPSNYSFEVQ